MVCIANPHAIMAYTWVTVAYVTHVLQFEYAAIQLNRLPWRRFVGHSNPVAIALMAKMKMAPADRPKVKL